MVSFAMPIEWHEKCLESSKAYEKRLNSDLAALTLKIVLLNAENQEYAAQIEEAKRKGKTAFDRDRFMKKRGEPSIGEKMKAKLEKG